VRQRLDDSEAENGTKQASTKGEPSLETQIDVGGTYEARDLVK
jgi:hypothetical protein